MINWYKTPKLVQRMFPKRVWTFPKETNAVFLTFDDGPIPNITPWVIQELKKYDAKATFFCIGENIKKHPDIFKTLISEGHSTGNHTNNHLNGWKTNVSEYVKNVILSEAEANKWNEKSKIKNPQSTITNHQSLFRPPYGKITTKQSKILQKRGCKIIMWDVLSADYNTSISEEKCLQNVLKSIVPGSIVVFHDSVKAEKNLRYTLPKVLDFISKKGWDCEKISLE
ncbi:MAG: peptidoglycan/xylan/chitin deacetylase (PgdA/CDA1 family) [Ulvibacter sp.]|jgi:peptidoglycan/xylan/chitin deacetylase (PgdA/CDA1 family)